MTPIESRAQLLRDLAAVLRRDLELHASTITAEMGKIIGEARAEVEKCAFVCEYFAANAAEFLADEPSPSDSPASFIAFQPLGTVLACMPWNFPYWQVVRCLAPAVAAGNCVVLKHASNVTRCGLRLADAVREAGFPEGVFTMLVLPASAIAGLIADPRIHAVSITGSTEAGRSVGGTAGANLKKSVLELGGSDAFVVLDDADVDAAAAIGREIAVPERRPELHRGQAIHRRGGGRRGVRGCADGPGPDDHDRRSNRPRHEDGPGRAR